MSQRRAGRPSFSHVLRIGEFRALWCAELLSQAGDQFARVALAVVVFDRTHSATLTALTYALTLVPAVVGGILLAGLGDHHSRRAVMIKVATMTLVAGPFKAAQQAVLPDVLPGPAYPLGMALRTITIQAAQLTGFATGGLLVAAIEPSLGLTLDAATFVASAILIRAGVGPHEPPAAATVRQSFTASSMTGARAIWRDQRLRALLAMTLLAGFYIVPEALAAPYATAIGAGSAAVGLIMAADPLGSVIGGFVFGRLVSAPWALRHLGPLACLAGVPLLACMAEPPLALSLVLLALGGVFATGYQIYSTTTFIRELPADVRAQGSGLASTLLITVQGVGALLAGAVADEIPPSAAIAFAGALGIASATFIGLAWTRANPSGKDVAP